MIVQRFGITGWRICGANSVSGWYLEGFAASEGAQTQNSPRMGAVRSDYEWKALVMRPCGVGQQSPAHRGP